MNKKEIVSPYLVRYSTSITYSVVLIVWSCVSDQNPACAADAEVTVGLEVSSVSGESDGEREEGEEDMLPSVLRPLHHKHQRVEEDFRNLMDQ